MLGSSRDTLLAAYPWSRAPAQGCWRVWLRWSRPATWIGAAAASLVVGVVFLFAPGHAQARPGGSPPEAATGARIALGASQPSADAVRTADHLGSPGPTAAQPLGEVTGASVRPPAVATIGGHVLLQGRTSTFPVQVGHGIATITLIPNGDCVSALVPPGNIQTSNTPDGTFELSNILDGNYAIRALAPGYLTACRAITVGNGALLGGALPNVSLPAGDTNPFGSTGYAQIDIQDVSLIAAAFGETPTNRVDQQGRVIDLNGDGIVEILDITAAASNFGRPPLPWPTTVPPPLPWS